MALPHRKATNRHWVMSWGPVAVWYRWCVHWYPVPKEKRQQLYTIENMVIEVPHPTKKNARCDASQRAFLLCCIHIHPPAHILHCHNPAFLPGATIAAHPVQHNTAPVWQSAVRVSPRMQAQAAQKFGGDAGGGHFSIGRRGKNKTPLHSSLSRSTTDVV
jgi:hypothetical protein